MGKLVSNDRRGESLRLIEMFLTVFMDPILCVPVEKNLLNFGNLN